MNTLFLTPLDVLYLRGNQHFGSAGAHGAALMPPWPSLVAGAIRSRLMADGATLESLASFGLHHFGLGQINAQGSVEPLLPLPSDVLVTHGALDDACYARAVPLHAGISSSQRLPSLPAFAQAKPAKPIGGLWLTAPGIRAWLAGTPIMPAHLRRASDLWLTDARLGIALDPKKRSAADGKIYTAEAIALLPTIGFVARYDGAPSLAENDLLRLGGDGRGAVVRKPTFVFPEPTNNDWQRIKRERRFRLLLTTPGLFPEGWQPTGIPATLVAASVNRAETISGWDLVTGQPKSAQRVVPVGSVYWFENFTGDITTLQALVRDGLHPDDPARYAEGYGKVAVAAWSA